MGELFYLLIKMMAAKLTLLLGLLPAVSCLLDMESVVTETAELLEGENDPTLTQVVEQWAKVQCMGGVATPELERTSKTIGIILKEIVKQNKAGGINPKLLTGSKNWAEEKHVSCKTKAWAFVEEIAQTAAKCTSQDCKKHAMQKLLKEDPPEDALFRNCVPTTAVKASCDTAQLDTAFNEITQRMCIYRRFGEMFQDLRAYVVLSKEPGSDPNLMAPVLNLITEKKAELKEIDDTIARRAKIATELAAAEALQAQGNKGVGKMKVDEFLKDILGEKDKIDTTENSRN